jgi:hypothetical protein
MLAFLRDDYLKNIRGEYADIFQNFDSYLVSVASDYVPEWILPFEPLEECGVPYKFLWEYYQQQGVHDWPYRPVHPELLA